METYMIACEKKGENKLSTIGNYEGDGIIRSVFPIGIIPGKFWDFWRDNGKPELIFCPDTASEVDPDSIPGDAKIVLHNPDLSILGMFEDSENVTCKNAELDVISGYSGKIKIDSLYMGKYEYINLDVDNYIVCTPISKRPPDPKIDCKGRAVVVRWVVERSGAEIIETLNCFKNFDKLRLTGRGMHLFKDYISQEYLNGEIIITVENEFDASCVAELEINRLVIESSYGIGFKLKFNKKDKFMINSLEIIGNKKDKRNVKNFIKKVAKDKKDYLKR